MRFQAFILYMLVSVFVTVAAGAQDLTIFGNEGSKVYDIEDLATTFPVKTIETVSTWTGEDIVSYKGISLSALLDANDLSSETVEISAENGYASKIPEEMIEKYQPIIAFEANGTALDFASRGPLSVIWPRSDHPQELGETIDGMWTWYVTEIRAIN